MLPISRRSLRVTWLLCALAVISSCASPTLPPLPPPSKPTISYQSTGEIVVEGTVPVPQARVLVLNNNTQKIFGQMVSEHRYRFVVEADEGDYLQLWYSSGRHGSVTADFEVPELEPAPQVGDAGAGQ